MARSYNIQIVFAKIGERLCFVHFTDLAHEMHSFSGGHLVALLVRQVGWGCFIKHNGIIESQAFWKIQLNINYTLDT